MRKFLVCYRMYLTCGNYDYCTKRFVLNADEKANEETFERKFNELGEWHREILAWSLIEE